MAKNTSEILVKVEENFTHELEEMITDGINIHITGTQIDKLQSIDIYFKEETQIEN